ncbi:hypothetical protein [Merismopedia glauca]|uniref:Uncharacterized protein n=1 Tax=Merismopedia glauca CCAP 1448/3 TaxID=1296344 RepID=A0A2T1C8N9_9CYAN|nr:hypothetical protein [Merismopedia glauca]PSB04604.1 hypothetical protein C7B64_03375 [Merismopedia glauca CCAP 1448/3]
MPFRIKINADVWSPLSAEEKSKVTEILKNTSLIEEGDEIVGDASVAVQAQGFLDNLNPGKKFCKIACDVAASAAAAACTAGTSGVALAACLAAAEVAREACRDAC